MQPKFTHVALLVSDIEETKGFYTKYCGMKVLEQRKDPKTSFRVIWFGQDLKFVIVAFEQDRNPVQSDIKPLSHLGFSLSSKEEVDKIAEIAKNEGFLNYGPAFFDKDVGYICEVLDPDGNSVEFSFGQRLG